MAEQSQIVVFVKLEYWDVYRATALLTFRQFRLVLIICGLVGLLMLALFFFAWIHPMPDREWFESARNAKPLLWVWGVPFLFVFVLPLLTAKRVLADERLKKGIRYGFSDSGIHVVSSVAVSDLQWTAFRHAVETKAAFLLLPSKTVAHIVPKRCFGSAVEIAALREIVLANIPKAKVFRD